MNALTVLEFSILVICIVIANTTAKRLTDGSLPNEDYGNDDDTLRWQLKQNKNLLASHQTQIQQLEGHQEEMQQKLEVQNEQIKQQLEAHQRDLHDQKLELVQFVHALLMRRKDDNLDGAMHHISKGEIPSDAYPINNCEELLNLLLESGIRGPPGTDGKDGEYGKDGEPGRDGDAGRVGDPGRDGADGEEGEAGRNGIDGMDGMDGKDGKDGVDGDNGHNGIDGAPGSPGPAGPTGVSGHDGTAGPQGPPGLPGTDNTADVNAGAVYTRWGRTTCPSHSTLVYEGFAGGSTFTTTGGGTNYQCLPTDPEYNKYSGNFNGWGGSMMAGAEYQTYNYGVFPSGALDQNVPCARCYTRNRAALMMIPGKRTCPGGWTKEYEGYLMAERNSHVHQSTFECVDQYPDYINGLTADTNGALFWFVKTVCSGEHTTGHCPPYISNRELTCVVCTQ